MRQAVADLGGQRLLPRQQGVVDVEGPGANRDGRVDPTWCESGVCEAERTVQRLCCGVRSAHRETKSGRPASNGLRFNGRDELGGDASLSVLGVHLEVLEARRVIAGEIGVPDGRVADPRHEVVAVTLIEPG